MTAERVALHTSDGIRLTARFWSAWGGADEPDRDTGYVIAHGFTGWSGLPRLQRICRLLAARGADVLAPDLRGHGRSGGRSTLGAAEVADVEAAVAWLRARGVGRVVTIGWSMGGSVVLRYAGLGGDTDAVVSISSPGHWYERGTPGMRVLHWVCETAPGRTGALLLRRVRISRDGWAEMPESPLEVADAIRCPLLIIHGDADHYFPLRHAELLAAAALSAQLWIEPGMGHAEAATTPDLIERVDAWVRAELATAGPANLRR